MPILQCYVDVIFKGAMPILQCYIDIIFKMLQKGKNYNFCEEEIRQNQKNVLIRRLDQYPSAWPNG